MRHSGWTASLRRRFIEHLSLGGNVRAAARVCGLSRQSAYKLRRRDPAFARDWDAALVQKAEYMEREWAEQAGAWRERQFSPWTPSTASTPCQPQADYFTHSSPISS